MMGKKCKNLSLSIIELWLYFSAEEIWLVSMAAAHCLSHIPLSEVVICVTTGPCNSFETIIWVGLSLKKKGLNYLCYLSHSLSWLYEQLKYLSKFAWYQPQVSWNKTKPQIPMKNQSTKLNDKWFQIEGIALKSPLKVNLQATQKKKFLRGKGTYISHTLSHSYAAQMCNTNIRHSAYN